MNKLLSLCLTLSLASTCLAQGISLGPSCEVQRQNPSCTTQPGCRNPRCTKCRPKICVNVPSTIRVEREQGCDQPPSRGGPQEQPPERGGPPDDQGVLQEMGAYIAPPRSGSTRGATNFTGIDGGSITLPEIRLRLPSFELPACFKSRAGARMNVDSAVAPWESHGFVQTGVGAGDLALRQRIAALEEELKNKESKPRGGSGDAADRAAQERGAAEDYAKKLQEYEDLLKRCEEEQQKLRECIQNCLEQHQGRGSSAPLQKPETKSPRQAPTQAPDDKTIGPPPIPTDTRFRRMPPVDFEEIPASYQGESTYLEPRRLIREPPPVSAPKPIREPKTPSVRITGFRPVR
jgi:hypothetical protein